MNLIGLVVAVCVFSRSNTVTLQSGSDLSHSTDWSPSFCTALSPPDPGTVCAPQWVCAFPCAWECVCLCASVHCVAFHRKADIIGQCQKYDTHIYVYRVKGTKMQDYNIIWRFLADMLIHRLETSLVCQQHVYMCVRRRGMMTDNVFVCVGGLIYLQSSLT